VPVKEREAGKRRSYEVSANHVEETDGERRIIASPNQGIFNGNYRPFMENIQANRERVNGSQNSNGNGESVYVGQWDALKEKMLWGTMGKELVSPLTTCFMSGATSPSFNDVEGSSASFRSTPCRNYGGKGGKKGVGMQGKGYTKGTKKGGDIQKPISPEKDYQEVRERKVAQVGVGKRKIDGGSCAGRESVGKKGHHAEEDSSEGESDVAEAALQPYQGP
jgi:hypothetical protein